MKFILDLDKMKNVCYNVVADNAVAAHLTRVNTGASKVTTFGRLSVVSGLAPFVIIQPLHTRVVKRSCTLNTEKSRHASIINRVGKGLGTVLRNIDKIQTRIEGYGSGVDGSVCTMSTINIKSMESVPIGYLN